MRKLTVLATFGLIALVSAGVLLFSPGTMGTAYAGGFSPCADQVGGTIDSNIILAVGSGTCHLTNVTVNGNIKIEHAGTRLHLHSSIVNGNIWSSGGGLNITNDGTVHAGGADTASTVNGHVNIRNCATTIQIADSTTGNVKLMKNGVVLVTDNTINGNLILLKNTNTTETGNTVSGVKVIK